MIRLFLVRQGELKMYHIKNNAKSIQSANLISTALFELLKEKSYEEITITDIYRKSYVSRGTFYRLFNTIDDVLYYEVDKIFSEIQQELVSVDYPNILRYFIEKTILNLDLFKIIIDNKKHSIILNCFDKHNKNFLAAISFESIDKEIQTHYELEIFGGILLAAIGTWYKFNQKESLDELTSRVISSINSLHTLFNLQ